jgi:hypothetical protein
MELPAVYRDLYDHWNFHLEKEKLESVTEVDVDVFSGMKRFVNERLSMFEKKEKGMSRPYSSDIVLNTFRFCNVFREFDRQTVFFHERLKPLENDFPLWLLNMLFARSICSTETVERLGYMKFSAAENVQMRQLLERLPSPKYGTAYIFPISVIQKSQWNTREKFFCLYYPLIVQKIAGIIDSFDRVSVVAALERILPVFGFNLRFLWTEVLIDIAYQYPSRIDLFKQFPVGPGARPTLRQLNSRVDPEILNVSLTAQNDSDLNLPTIDGKRLHLSAENWEGIACEFRKYSNLSKGTGRRRLYR